MCVNSASTVLRGGRSTIYRKVKRLSSTRLHILLTSMQATQSREKACLRLSTGLKERSYKD